MAARTRLRFERFEFKYVLPADLRHEVETELGYFVDFDPFVEHTVGHRYLVRSLYFDDPSFTCFHDKHDGVRTRWKFRVRTYTDDPASDTPCFLELKGRHDNLVFKRRVLIGDSATALLRGGGPFPSEALVEGITDDPAEQFRYELLRKQLRPVAVVDYLRRPYVSRYDPEFRLTFDERLGGTMASTLFPSPTARRRRIIPGYTVIEVKFRHHIPSWFHRIIQSYELRRVSISKICAAMETLEMAERPA